MATSLSQKLEIYFIVLPDRVGLDEFAGTGKTVEFGLICLPDTKEKSKNRFSQIAYSGHVTCFNEKIFVQGVAQKSELQYPIVKLGLSGRQRGEKMQFLAIFLILCCQNWKDVQKSR